MPLLEPCHWLHSTTVSRPSFLTGPQVSTVKLAEEKTLAFDLFLINTAGFLLCCVSDMSLSSHAVAIGKVLKQR